jgi:hypothetical protein
MVEKKNSIVMNSTGGASKEITKGNISFIIPNEQPNQNEATVAVDIKDIRFGSNAVSVPEITAIVNGSKVVVTVPFKEPLQYHFKRVEDEMVFKYAVTSAGDLLGFVYFELPQKYKSMKKFRLDEWVPVKHLSFEENDKLVKENFVARIVLEYRGLRKLEDLKVGPKLPKAQMLEDLAKNMKQTVNNINEELEIFGEDGFKHLASFEKKLLKKKINLNSRMQDPRKIVRTVPGETKIGDSQKELFYRTKGTMGETQQVKAQALAPSQFFDKTVNIVKFGKDASGDCSRCENLVKELQFSHRELLESNQKITGLEQGKVVVDNEKLKRDLDKIYTELNKDKKEVSLRLRDNTSLLEQETKKIRKHYEAETGKVLSQQSEAKLYIEDLRAKLKVLEARENSVNTQTQELLDVEARIAAKEAQTDQEASNLDMERIMLEEEEAEMIEMKTRMMLERQRVCEEANELQFMKGDTDLRQKQMAAMEAFLNEEKQAFRRYVDKKNDELDRIKAELEDQREIHGHADSAFQTDLEDYEARNKELMDAINRHRQEVAKFHREKKAHLAHMAEFSTDKGTIEGERTVLMKDIEKDYEYLEERNKQLSEQKTELEALMNQLDEFEASLQNQNRLQQEQHSRFLLQQKQFFKRLKDTNFDPKEMKKLAEEVGAVVNGVDDTEEDAQKRERELSRNRAGIRKQITTITDNSFRDPAEGEVGQSSIERKATNKTQRGDALSTVTSAQAEVKIKLHQDAFNLVDKIFSNAIMAEFARQNGQKDELIDNLKGSVVKLENKLKDMHKKIKSSKLNFFTTKNPTSQKVQVLSNPFADKGLSDPEEVPSQEVVGEKNVEVPGLLHQEDRLNELQERLEDLCDSAIKMVNELNGGKQTAKAKDRIEYLIQIRKSFQNTLTLIKNVNEGHTGEEAALTFEYDDFDIKRLKVNLEAKLRDLVAFIDKVKKSNDFFNPNIDQDILAARI